MHATASAIRFPARVRRVPAGSLPSGTVAAKCLATDWIAACSIFPALRIQSPVYLPGFTNRNVIRSDSPMAAYFARSLSPSARVGGSVHTPSG